VRSVVIQTTSVTSVIVLGTWHVTVLAIAATLEQHHHVAGNMFHYIRVTYSGMMYRNYAEPLCLLFYKSSTGCVFQRGSTSALPF